MIFAGVTATWPVALVSKRLLWYKDIEFQVFLPLAKGLLPVVIMVLNLKNIKRSSGTQKPWVPLLLPCCDPPILPGTDSSRKLFAFYEGENLTCCLVLFTMALALADNTFKNKFTSLTQIYDLVVDMSETDHICLK
jgi:hypothetical protein